MTALWEFERRHNGLPEGNDGEASELATIAEEIRLSLGINLKALPAIDPMMLE